MPPKKKRVTAKKKNASAKRKAASKSPARSDATLSGEIPSLPNELWIYIIQSLCRVDLKALRLVSKLFHHLSTPTLFSILVFAENTEDGPTNLTTKAKATTASRKMSPVISRLKGDAEFAVLVKEMKIKFITSVDEDGIAAATPTMKSLRKFSTTHALKISTYKALAQHCPISQLYAHPYTGHQPVIPLDDFPLLDSLSITPTMMSYAAEYLKRTGDRIKCIKIDGRRGSVLLDPDFDLPNLERVKISGAAPSLVQKLLPGRSATLRKVNVGWYHFNPVQWEEEHNYPNLTDFRVYHQRQPIGPALTRAIHGYAASLQVLWLRDALWPGDLPSRSFFAPLTKLRVLYLSVDGLDHFKTQNLAECLPPTIKSLTLDNIYHRESNRDWPPLRRLVGRLPNLRFLDISRSWNIGVTVQGEALKLVVASKSLEWFKYRQGYISRTIVVDGKRKVQEASMRIRGDDELFL